MISRLSAYAATFAVIATATIAFAASAQARIDQQQQQQAAARAVPVVQLETVVVTGHRTALADSK
ncbi:MAG TPA: hypothetical protein VJO99_02590 [Burkholderiaceae bacterium]|nr:hypothetical protein [Burkholderiaceae bacterium]